jgi:hypothetical protein
MGIYTKGVCFKLVFKYKHERLQGILESTQKGLLKWDRLQSSLTWGECKYDHLFSLVCRKLNPQSSKFNTSNIALGVTLHMMGSNLMYDIFENMMFFIYYVVKN